MWMLFMVIRNLEVCMMALPQCCGSGTKGITSIGRSCPTVSFSTHEMQEYDNSFPLFFLLSCETSIASLILIESLQTSITLITRVPPPKMFVVWKAEPLEFLLQLSLGVKNIHFSFFLFSLIFPFGAKCRISVQCRCHALKLYCVFFLKKKIMSWEESACSLCECVCVSMFTMRENLCNSIQVIMI